MRNVSIYYIHIIASSLCHNIINVFSPCSIQILYLFPFYMEDLMGNCEIIILRKDGRYFLRMICVFVSGTKERSIKKSLKPGSVFLQAIINA